MANLAVLRAVNPSLMRLRTTPDHCEVLQWQLPQRGRLSRMKNAKKQGSQPPKSRRKDAIALLKADHRQVEAWFKEFEKTNSQAKRTKLAQRICGALKIHTRIEEEIFYPAFLAAGIDKDMHHEAEVEHDAAKELIAAIEDFGPEDEYFEARAKVLSEMIKHHVKEEEQRGGMFAKARAAKLDLKQLGERMKQRKQELEGDGP